VSQVRRSISSLLMISSLFRVCVTSLLEAATCQQPGSVAGSWAKRRGAVSRREFQPRQTINRTAILFHLLFLCSHCGDRRRRRDAYSLLAAATLHASEAQLRIRTRLQERKSLPMREPNSRGRGRRTTLCELRFEEGPRHRRYQGWVGRPEARGCRPRRGGLALPSARRQMAGWSSRGACHPAKCHFGEHHQLPSIIRGVALGRSNATARLHRPNDLQALAEDRQG